MNALRLLAETLTKSGIPPDWLCVANPYINHSHPRPKRRFLKMGMDTQVMRRSSWLGLGSSCAQLATVGTISARNTSASAGLSGPVAPLNQKRAARRN